jgi:hypothetical protein
VSPRENQSARKQGQSQSPWRPPARESQQAHTRRLVRAVALSLALSGLALFGFARVARDRPNAIKLGDTEFEVGSAVKFAASIDAKGPLFFPDLVVDDDVNRPVVLTHVSGKDFAALNALPPGSKDQTCVVSYDRTSKLLVDPCTKISYALDGLSVSGNLAEPKLVRFRSEVKESGALTINLNELYPEELRERNPLSR